jgi:hypothetical protein
MDKTSRRDAVREYKERKPQVGAFAVRCAATGQAWVGVSKSLDQMQNRIWFGLRTGGHPNRELQAAWREHGEAAFSYEPLEALDVEDASPLAIDLKLKDVEKRWREQLGAAKVAG